MSDWNKRNIINLDDNDDDRERSQLNSNHQNKKSKVVPSNQPTIVSFFGGQGWEHHLETSHDNWLQKIRHDNVTDLTNDDDDWPDKPSNHSSLKRYDDTLNLNTLYNATNSNKITVPTISKQKNSNDSVVNQRSPSSINHSKFITPITNHYNYQHKDINNSYDENRYKNAHNNVTDIDDILDREKEILDRRQTRPYQPISSYKYKDKSSYNSNTNYKSNRNNKYVNQVDEYDDYQNYDTSSSSSYINDYQGDIQALDAGYDTHNESQYEGASTIHDDTVKSKTPVFDVLAFMSSSIKSSSTQNQTTATNTTNNNSNNNNSNRNGSSRNTSIPLSLSELYHTEDSTMKNTETSLYSDTNFLNYLLDISIDTLFESLLLCPFRQFLSNDDEDAMIPLTSRQASKSTTPATTTTTTTTTNTSNNDATASSTTNTNTTDMSTSKAVLTKTKIRYLNEDQYIEIYEQLLLSEIQAAIRNYFMNTTIQQLVMNNTNISMTFISSSSSSNSSSSKKSGKSTLDKVLDRYKESKNSTNMYMYDMKNTVYDLFHSLSCQSYHPRITNNDNSENCSYENLVNSYHTYRKKQSAILQQSTASTSSSSSSSSSLIEIIFTLPSSSSSSTTTMNDRENLPNNNNVNNTSKYMSNTFSSTSKNDNTYNNNNNYNLKKDSSSHTYASLQKDTLVLLCYDIQDQLSYYERHSKPCPRIDSWIDLDMKYKSCLGVIIDTSSSLSNPSQDHHTSHNNRNNNSSSGGGNINSYRSEVDQFTILVHSSYMKTIYSYPDSTTSTRFSTNTSTSTNNNNQSTSSSSSSSSSSHSLRLSEGRMYSILPIMNISTFLREWSALHSIKNHTLMPLAPYILKAAPVVSANKLTEMNNHLIGKIKTLENLHSTLTQIIQNNTQNHTTSTRSSIITHHTHTRTTYESRLENAYIQMEKDITFLNSIEIDGSVLLKSNIVTTLSKIKKNSILIRLHHIVKLLLDKWKDQIKQDNRESTVRNLKGGNVLVVPTDRVHVPVGVPSALWNTLENRYNNSQLYAIKYVSDQMNDTQDTRIALIQGPPGTGKTSTILGMISALLHRQSHHISTSTHTQQDKINTQSSSFKTSDQVSNTSSTSNSTSTTAANTADNERNTSKTTTSDVKTPQNHTQSYNYDSTKKNRLLLCAPSNAAIDELLTRLSTGILSIHGQTRHMNIIRMGDPSEGCPEDIKKLSLEYQTEENVKKSNLWIYYDKYTMMINNARDQLNELITKYGHKISSNTKNDYSDDTLPKTNANISNKIQKLKQELYTLRRDRAVTLTNIDRYRMDIRRDLIYQADIVAATLSSSGKQIFLDHIIRDELRFDTALIDESAQATEPSTLIPLRYGCKRLVLVGDPRQLPATVLSTTAERAGLGTSLFERLEKAGHPVVMLTIQYRMHPEIRSFPSDYFYQGKLTDAPIIQKKFKDHTQHSIHTHSNHQINGPVSQEIQSILSLPIQFYNINSTENSTGTSYRNDDEIKYMMKYLDVLYHTYTNISQKSNNSSNQDTSQNKRTASSIDRSKKSSLEDIDECSERDIRRLSGDTTTVTTVTSSSETSDNDVSNSNKFKYSVGIISPYKAQVKKIKQKLLEYINTLHSTTTNSNTNSSSSSSSLSNHTHLRQFYESIEVNTVDGFQGKEKDIILFSCVRTSTRSIGFLGDERRINVAITRAKYHLIIFGFHSALYMNSIWRAYIESIELRKLLFQDNCVIFR